METDCLNVVQALRSQVNTASYFGCIVAECLSLLQSLSDVSIVFVKRSANMVAHELARFSCCGAERSWTLEDLPSSVFAVLAREVC